MDKKRKLFFYKDYFRKFYSIQTSKVRSKMLWTLRIVEEMDRIPEVYFKHLEGTNALYEIRIQFGGNIFRVFCFFDNDDLIVVGHGYQKKTSKTPQREIERAELIKQEYYEEKKINKLK